MGFGALLVGVEYFLIASGLMMIAIALHSFQNGGLLKKLLFAFGGILVVFGLLAIGLQFLIIAIGLTVILLNRRKSD